MAKKFQNDAPEIDFPKQGNRFPELKKQLPENLNGWKSTSHFVEINFLLWKIQIFDFDEMISEVFRMHLSYYQLLINQIIRIV